MPPRIPACLLLHPPSQTTAGQVAHECLTEYQRTVLNLPDGLPGIVMAIHTFGEYLDFHPHLHALVADGLFMRDGQFHVAPQTALNPLEEMFRARIITFLLEKRLLPPERARMLRGWVPSGFNVHRSNRVQPHQREDLERLAQYIPDKSFQLVRYYGWYSNKMRGQRDKRDLEAAKAVGNAIQIIDVSEHKPRRIPFAKWRELIKSKIPARRRRGRSGKPTRSCVRAAPTRCGLFR